jgi:hypothetical protein
VFLAAAHHAGLVLHRPGLLRLRPSHPDVGLLQLPRRGDELASSLLELRF